MKNQPSLIVFEGTQHRKKHKCAHLTHKLAALPWEMQIIIFQQYST